MRTAKTLSINDILSSEENKAKEQEQEIKTLHRPFPNVSKTDFFKLFNIEANKIMAQLKIFPSNFKSIESQKELLRQLYYHFTGSSEFKGDVNKGIFIHGPNGTGKSIILMAYVKMFSHFRKEIVCCKSIDLGLIIRNKESLQTFIRRPLYIDDIGYESTEASDYKATIKPMANVLFSRYDLGSWTFGTGQVAIKSKPYEDKYGKSITDRMIAMFNEFELKGKSLRK